jgi:DNA helicase IV
VRDLQLFNREADKIEASTSARAKFLDTIAVGDSYEDVEASIKRHDDFSATLAAQEERVNQLRETADRLVAAGHPDAATIAEKRDKVLAARNRLKEEAAKKREILEESKVFQVRDLCLLLYLSCATSTPLHRIHCCGIWFISTWC